MAWSQDLFTDDPYNIYEIGITQNSHNITNNTTNVTIQVWGVRKLPEIVPSGVPISIAGNGVVRVKIDGTLYTENITSSQVFNKDGVYIFSKTLDINHDKYGSKTLTVSAQIEHEYFTSAYQSYDETLVPFDRKSSFKLKNESTRILGVENGIKLQITRLDSDFTHSIKYTTLANSGKNTSNWTTLFDKTSGVDLQFTLPLSNASNYVDKQIGFCYLELSTYYENALIGKTYLSFDFTIPNNSSTQPDVSAVLSKINKTLSFDEWIQGNVGASATITAKGKYGATIKSYALTIDGVTASGLSNVQSIAKINKSGSVGVKVTATDSRGYVGTYTTNINVIPYSIPAISDFKAERCNASGVADDKNGEYVHFSGRVVWSPINNGTSNLNVPKLSLYSSKDESIYLKVADLVNGDSFDYTINRVDAADVDSLLFYRIDVTDIITTSPIKRYSEIDSTFSLIDFNASGNGIAFGMASEQDKFEVNMDSVFKSVTTQSGADLDNVRTRLNNVGTIVGGSSVTNDVKAATYTVLRKFSLPAGVWVISASIEFTAQFNEIYVTMLYNETSSKQMTFARTSAMGGGGSDVSYIFSSTTTLTIDLRCYKPTAGTTRSRMTAVRIA